MRRATTVLLALAATATSAPRAAELSLQDFAYGMPITTPGDAAAYRFAVPLEVYQQVVRSDLADLRIFNGRGEVVPYAIERSTAATYARPAGKLLPLFALRDDSQAGLNALQITMASQGSAIRLQTSDSGPMSGRVASYVLDCRGLDSRISAMQVRWPDGAPDYAGNIRVEAADVLGSWRIVTDSAPIANLHANGAQLIEDRMEFPATRAKFWRLSWLGTAPPFDLLSATVEPATVGDTFDRSQIVMTGTPDGTRPGEFQFDLRARLPIDRINLELPELNTLVEADFLSRSNATDPWRSVALGGFYRLKGADGELRNGPIATDIDSDRFWLVRIREPNNAMGRGALRLEARWRSPEVVFLARGSGPFTLAYGNGSLTAAESALAPLPTSVTPTVATLGAPRTLGGAENRNRRSEALPWKRIILWTALLAGVALLAGMAYRLSKEVGKHGAP
jgi:hypothetical protein